MSENGKVYAQHPQVWENARLISSNRKLRTISIEEGIILPVKKHRFATFTGGVFDRNKKYVAGLIRKDVRHPSGWELNNSVWPEDVQVEKSDETILFGGAAATHFGHFLLDGLNRMWSCIQEENKKFRIAYLLMPLWGKYDWIWDFFALLNIPRERILIVTKPTQFARIIVPEESAHTLLSWYTEHYCMPFKYMMKQAGEPAFLKKIYLAKDPKSRIRGENYFLQFYQAHGYVPVRPESLFVKDQVRLLAGAEEVVCTLGTLSHLALFCKPGTKFTMLTHTDELLQAQALINKVSGVDWTVVDVSQNIFFATHWRGIHLIGPNQNWSRYVKEKWGEYVEPNLNKEECFEYIKDLCKHYEAFPKRFIADVERNNAYEVFSRIFDIMLGKEMDKNLFDYENYKDDRLRKRMAERKLKNLLEAYENVIGRPVLEVDVHLSSVGWKVSRFENLLGDGEHPIEALRISCPERNLSIRYATYTKKYGWGEEAADGEMTGSVGKKLPISGIYAKVGNSSSDNYSILYRILGEDGNWSGWAKDGERIFNESGLSMIRLEMKLSAED